MKNLKYFFAALIPVFALFIFSCTKEEQPIVEDKYTPTIPDCRQMLIHFGHTVYEGGCVSTFRNCIYIDLFASAKNINNQLAIVFEDGNAVTNYYGAYFPLTDDLVVDAEMAARLGIEQQTFKAGLYPIQDTPLGKAIRFRQDNPMPVSALVNPHNPQDDIGQLHNLAIQNILNPVNNEKINILRTNSAALDQFLNDQTVQFLSSVEVPVSAEEQIRMALSSLSPDYENYSLLIEQTTLSANDKKVMLSILDEATAIDVNSPETLSRYVDLIKNYETSIAASNHLDNPRLVLSALSVMKYSRYYWYWKSMSTAPNGTVGSAQQKKWWLADLIGLLEGGLGTAVEYSIAASKK